MKKEKFFFFGISCFEKYTSFKNSFCKELLKFDVQACQGLYGITSRYFTFIDKICSHDIKTVGDIPFLSISDRIFLFGKMLLPSFSRGKKLRGNYNEANSSKTRFFTKNNYGTNMRSEINKKGIYRTKREKRGENTVCFLSIPRSF